MKHNNNNNTPSKEVEQFDPHGDHRTYSGLEDLTVRERPTVVPIINKTLSRCQVERKRAYMPPSRPGGAREKYCLHPSQSAGCPRKVQFSVINARRDDRPPDPQRERMFDMGHESHRRLQGYFFEAWRRQISGVTRVWEDVKISIPDIRSSGELDLIFELRCRDRYVTEIKTASTSVFDRLTAPKKDWVWQLHLYMKGVGLRSGVILVECRNDGRLKEFWVPWSDETWKSIQLQAYTIWSDTEEQKLSIKQPEPGECMWCDYKEICKTGHLQRKIDWERVWK